MNDQLTALKIVRAFYADMAPAGAKCAYSGKSLASALAAQDNCLQVVDQIIAKLQASPTTNDQRISSMQLVYEAADAYLQESLFDPDAAVLQSALGVVDVMITEAEDAGLDWKDAVKLANNVTNNHGHVEGMLCISTSHLTEMTAHGLGTDLAPEVIGYNHGQYGWQVSIPLEENAWDIVKAHNKAGALPDDLFGCMEFARSLDCPWLLLDQDAAAISDLKTYDW
jgi:hypothetical protein